MKIQPKYLIIIGFVLAGLILSSIKNHQIKKLTETVTTLKMSNIAIENERYKLDIANKIKEDSLKIVNARIDSLKKVLKNSELQMSILKQNHEKELAELSKIPADTVFKRLQMIYYNYGNLPLKYPFASSQIASIYKTAVNYDNLIEESVAQQKTLNTCFTLNDSFEKANKNLTGQVDNIKLQLSGCDNQKANLERVNMVLNKQVAKKTFWNRVLTGAAITSLIIAVTK